MTSNRNGGIQESQRYYSLHKGNHACGSAVLRAHVPVRPTGPGPWPSYVYMIFDLVSLVVLQ